MQYPHYNINAGQVPHGFKRVAPGERVHKGDVRAVKNSGDEWEAVPRWYVGKKVGTALVLRPVETYPIARDLEAVIREKLNALEIVRDRLRGEIDNPPAGAGVYYFTDRTSEHRTICLMIEAVRDLLK